MLENNPPFLNPELEVAGGALETHGLSVKGAIFPLSALMFGLVWNCANIWSIDDPPSTTWTPTSTTSSTTWTPTATTSSTTWTTIGDDCL